MLGRALLLAVVLGACGAGAPSASAPAATEPVTPSARPGIQTVTYCTNGGTPLAMDISLPVPHAALAPAVLYVHGGGWEHGNRLGGGFLEQLRPALLQQGFVVASIDYRLAPKDRWPAQIVDTKCAVRYLRAYAGAYGIDARRIGAWGGSAGGHLVSMLGTADESAGFDLGEWSDQSSRVQAVVDLFGPADLTAGGWESDPSGTVREVFGATPGTGNEILAKASPVTYVSKDDPPFLIIQGDADHTVPASQSQTFAAKLQAAGAPATLLMVKGGPHGLGDPREQPGPDAIVARIVAFFVRTLSGM